MSKIKKTPTEEKEIWSNGGSPTGKNTLTSLLKTRKGTSASNPRERQSSVLKTWASGASSTNTACGFPSATLTSNPR